MARFLKSVIAQNESVTAGTSVTYDLPVNPLSHVNLVLNFLNVDNIASLSELLAAVTRVEVLYRGQAICSASLADLWALTTYLLQRSPMMGNHITADNAARWLGLMIPFGRVPFNPDECIMQTRAGELQLQITYAPAFIAFDNVTVQLESVELLDASPKGHIKFTTLNLTPQVGQNDLDLPIGNDIAGILLFSGTVPDGESATTSADQVKILVDNSEQYYSLSNWESMRVDAQWRTGPQNNYSPAVHRLIEGTPNVMGSNQQVDDDLETYAYLDFDPLLDSSYLLKTAGAASAKIRITGGDTNAIRAIPVELVRH